MGQDLKLDDELSTKFRETLLKSIDSLKEAVTNLDVTKEIALEHIATLSEDIYDNVNDRLGYVVRIRREGERLLAIENAQKGRVTHRNMASLIEATTPTQPKPSVIQH